MDPEIVDLQSGYPSLWTTAKANTPKKGGSSGRVPIPMIRILVLLSLRIWSGLLLTNQGLCNYCDKTTPSWLAWEAWD